MVGQSRVAAGRRSETAGENRPFPPSFIDRLIASVERLPWPYWVTYFTLFSLLSLLNHVLGWLDGYLPAYQFSVIHFLFPLWLFAPLAFITYLDTLALDALEKFKTLLDLPEAAMDRLQYEFTTMPARTVFLNSTAWFVFFIFVQYAGFEGYYVANGVGTAATIFGVVLGFVANWFGCSIYLHAYRQLRLVNDTLKMAGEVSLFNLEPIYAFSRLTAQTGLTWVILLSLTILFFPLQLGNGLVFSMYVSMTVLALAAFLLPLRTVNRRLVEEKRDRLSEVDRRIERTIEQIHRDLDENELDEIGKLNGVLTALGTGREAISRIPTWPWRAGTFSKLLSAIVLPLFLFLVQLVLGNWLAGAP